METILKQLEDTQIELTVTIPSVDVNKALKDAYAKAADNRIKGFRKGKAPRNVLDNLYGGPEYFLAEATDEIVKASFLLAIDSQDLVPLDQPDMVDIEPAVEGQDYSYKFTFNIAPEYELSSYDPLTIELPSEEPTDAEIQSKIDTMLGYYVEYIEISDRASQNGDVLTLDMQVTHDGETVQSMSGEGLPYELGIDAMPEDFEKHFIGILPCTELSIDFKLPYFDGADDGQDQDLHAEATLRKISVRELPALTDEWVKEKLEYEGVEHFRQLLGDSIRLQKQSSMPSLKERRVADAIALRLEGDPPEALVSDFAQDIYRDIFNTLQRQGVTLDVFLASTGQTADTFREEVQSQAVANSRQAMALDTWARHFEITVSDEDIRNEFTNSGAEDPEALFKEWISVGRIAEIRQGIRRMKASKQLNEEALITEEKTNQVEQPEVDKPKKTRRSKKDQSTKDQSTEVVEAELAVLPDATQTAKAQAAAKPEKKTDQNPTKVAEATASDPAKATKKTETNKALRPTTTPQATKKTGRPKKV